MTDSEFDTQLGQDDGDWRIVAAAYTVIAEAVTVEAGQRPTAHGAEDRIRVIRIFMGFRPVAVGDIREDTTGQRLDSQLLQVVVWISLGGIEALFIREDGDREDAGVAVLADAFKACLEEPACDEASFRRSVASIVQRAEWNLGAGAGFECAEIMPESLGGLLAFPFKHIDGIPDGISKLGVHHLAVEGIGVHVQPIFGILPAHSVWHTAQVLKAILQMTLEAHANEGRKVRVDVDRTDAAILALTLQLHDDGDKLACGAEAGWWADVTVSGLEAFTEQLLEIDHEAVVRAHIVVVEVMLVDLSFAMRVGDLLIHVVVEGDNLLQDARGFILAAAIGIFIDIGVCVLDVGTIGLGSDLMDGCVLQVALPGTFSAIENVFSGNIFSGRVHKQGLNHVLNLLDGQIFSIGWDTPGDAKTLIAIYPGFCFFHGGLDRTDDLNPVKRNGTTISFDDLHRINLSL